MKSEKDVIPYARLIFLEYTKIYIYHWVTEEYTFTKTCSTPSKLKTVMQGSTSH